MRIPSLTLVAALFIALFITLSAARASPPRVTPLAPTDPVLLTSWPFAPVPSADAMPGLTPQAIPARLTPAGCGALTWSRLPLPGEHGPGPWCIAIARRPDARPGGGLLALARPGEPVIVLLPMTVEIERSADQTTLRRRHALLADPALIAALTAWAAAPERPATGDVKP